MAPRTPDLTHPILADTDTIAKTAQVLDCSIRTVYGLIKQGLPVVTVGNLTLVDTKRAPEWLRHRNADKPKLRGRPRKIASAR